VSTNQTHSKVNVEMKVKWLKGMHKQYNIPGWAV
jgi:hypothetical protein